MQTDEIKNKSQPLPLADVIGGFFKVDDSKNWIEDFEHENGNYINACKICNSDFKGHKRRVFCKDCATTKPIFEHGKLISFGIEESQQLANILQEDRERGITINTSQPKQFEKIEHMGKGDKKAFWKKGKLRLK